MADLERRLAEVERKLAASSEADPRANLEELVLRHLAAHRGEAISAQEIARRMTLEHPRLRDKDETERDVDTAILRSLVELRNQGLAAGSPRLGWTYSSRAAARPPA